MAKSHRRSHRGKRHTRKSRRHGRRRHYMSGGATSAATYAAQVAGPLDTQVSRALGPGAVYPDHGNTLVPLVGVGAANPMVGAPNASQMALAQNGGRRRKRGGFLGPVISQAVVPFALWGMQNKYATRKRR